jgi:hypothetical protein
LIGWVNSMFPPSIIKKITINAVIGVELKK